MRSGECLAGMSQDQLRKIFNEGTPSWLGEIINLEFNPQTIIDWLDTQTYFDLLDQPYPSSQKKVLEIFENEELIIKDGENYLLPRMTPLILAKNLDNFPDVKRKAPRVVVYNGVSKVDTKLDQTGVKGYAVGFQNLVKFIMDQLPQNEVIEDALRKEIKLIPEIAIRELVANALIHQEFNESGASVLFEIYKDRIEISNPGEPLVPVERFIDGYKSRNQELAHFMRRLGICEEKSSGIDKVVHAAEAFQLPAPDFRCEFNRTSVVICGPKPFDLMTRDERIRACYQHCVLKWVMNQNMTNQSLRERFRLQPNKSVTISQVLNYFLNEGLIKTDEKAGGSRKFARYIPFWA